MKKILYINIRMTAQRFSGGSYAKQRLFTYWEKDLISKKDLLELTGISYGQLYRWKRKGLIPEDWFIKRSSFTGQETFFPKSKVLPRIDRIKNMKDDVSLDDLASIFSPSLDEINLTKEEAVSRGVITPEVLKIFLECRGERQTLGYDEIVCAYIFNKLLLSGDLNLDEAKMLLDVLEAGLFKFRNSPCELLLTRKLGVTSFFFVSPPCSILPDKGVKIVGKLNMASVTEELKLLLL